MAGSPIARQPTRFGASVDHNVAAKPGQIAPFGTGLLDIRGIRVIDAQGEMVPAVRVEKLDPIQPFRNLLVTLSELWAGHSTRGEDGIGENESMASIFEGGVEFQSPLLLQGQRSQITRRKVYSRLVKDGTEATLDSRSQRQNDILDRSWLRRQRSRTPTLPTIPGSQPGQQEQGGHRRQEPGLHARPAF